MKPGMALLPGVAADAGYNIGNSVLFDGTSGYLSKTLADSNQQIMTVSFWLKQDKAGEFAIFGTTTDGGSTPDYISTYPGTEELWLFRGGGNTTILRTDARYRDYSAWTHFVVAYDTTQAVLINRVKLYTNGELVTDFSTTHNIAQNHNLTMNTATYAHYIGRRVGSTSYLRGSLADFYFVDGQQLSASDFGETDAKTGNWIPKKYIGTYGTNGFLLDFSDAYDLGKDVSASNTTLDHSGYTATAPTGGTANNAKDGDTTTVVTTSSTPVTNNVIVKYDCGSAQTVSNVKVSDYTQAHTNAVSYKVEYSTDDSSWTLWDAAVSVTPGNVAFIKHIVDTETSARYWRLLAAQNHDAAVSVGEFSLMTAAGNNFSTNGTVTQTTNTPTNTSAIINPLEMPGVNSLVGTITFTDGNLTVMNVSSKNAWAVASLRMEENTGIWYAEFTGGADVQNLCVGIAGTTRYPNANRFIGMDDDTYGYDPLNGQKVTNNSYTSYGDAYTTDEIVGIEIDTDNGTINFWNEGVDQGEAFSSLSGPYFFANSIEYSAIGTWAFSEADLTHLDSVTNAKALTTNNLPKQSGNIDDHFKTVLYTGTGSSLDVTGVGFQPDFVWIKGRSGATEHVWTDAVRGVTKELNCNDTTVEETVAQGLTAFGSDGFTVGTDASYNTSSATYVAWCAKLDTTVTENWSGSPSITPSKEMYNSTLGMSIIKWTGTGSLGTIPHSLGKKPSMMIFKNLGDGNDWLVTHKDYSNGFADGLQYLNTTAAETTATTGWNDTEPTDALITVNTANGTNGTSDPMIAYIFAETEFCKIGSYIGNGAADGTFINMGGSPVWSMVKWHATAASAEPWIIKDIVTGPYNPNEDELYANSAASEDVGASHVIDFLSNGQKCRGTGGANNVNTGNYIYLNFVQPNGPIENNGR